MLLLFQFGSASNSNKSHTSSRYNVIDNIVWSGLKQKKEVLTFLLCESLCCRVHHQLIALQWVKVHVRDWRWVLAGWQSGVMTLERWQDVQQDVQLWCYHVRGQLHAHWQPQEVTNKRFLVGGGEADHATASSWNDILFDLKCSKEAAKLIGVVSSYLQYIDDGSDCTDITATDNQLVTFQDMKRKFHKVCLVQYLMKKSQVPLDLARWSYWLTYLKEMLERLKVRLPLHCEIKTACVISVLQNVTGMWHTQNVLSWKQCWRQHASNQNLKFNYPIDLLSVWI